MKNKGLIITLIILLLVIIILLAIFLVACLNGTMNVSGGFINLGAKSSNIVFDEEYEEKEMTSIEIDQDAGDITFEKAEEDKIRVVAYGKNEDDVEVTLENGKLKINHTKYHQAFSFFNFRSTKDDIIIYLPADYANNIKIKNDYGNCRITDLENATIHMDCDAGNVTLGKIKDATIKCDYGNVEIETVLNKCDIKADCRKY